MCCKTLLCLLLLAAAGCLPQTLGKPQDIAGKADQIFDAARQTVTDVIGVAQTVVNGAIEAGKNTVVGNINTVQNGVKLAVDTGRNVIAFAEDTVLSMLNGDIKVSVMVPKEAELSKSAKLECNWKLNGNASLYSVKWYKDEYEFFSYNPDNRDNTITTRILNGVVVDERASKKNEVMLTDLTLNSTGQYKCEVSTDAPFYHTNYSTGHLTVISLPSQGPEIRGLGTQYALGENVTANCTAWPSVPQAKLHWTVNNKEVPDKYVIKHKPHSPLDNQGTPNSLGLRLELESRHMAGSGGTLRVRCVSHVASRRQEVEQTAKLTHANNQRYSAGDLRSRASIVSLSSIALLAALLLT